MNTSSTTAERFDGFSGMDLSSPCGKTYCYPENFRVLSDRSLEKREGCRAIAALHDTIRGMYSFYDGGVEIMLAVAGDRLYRIEKSGRISYDSVLETTAGKVSFFLYRGSLLILDGQRLYRYDGGCSASPAEGYTPLYGKNWDPYLGCGQPVFESINLLSSRVRVHYSIYEDLSSVQIGLDIKSVEAVELNGILISNGDYILSQDKSEIQFIDSYVNGDLVLTVTPVESYYGENKISSVLYGAVFDDFDRTRVFLYGGEQASCLYASVILPSQTVEQDRAQYSDSTGLYFPIGCDMEFGNGQPLNAIHRLYDRMLLLFSDSVWVSEPLDKTLEGAPSFSPICNHTGCSSRNGFLMADGASPIAVTLEGIYRLSFNPDFEIECKTECLSNAIESRLTEGFTQRAIACHHRKRGELWFRDPLDDQGRIWILQLERKTWYSFILPPADGMFAYGGEVGFYQSNEIYLFDPCAEADIDSHGEHEILGIFEGHLLGLSCPWERKHLYEVTLLADLDGGELTLCLMDGETLASCVITPQEEEAIGSYVYRARLPSERFYTARPTFTTRHGGRQRLYAIEFKEQKGKE